MTQSFKNLNSFEQGVYVTKTLLESNMRAFVAAFSAEMGDAPKDWVYAPFKDDIGGIYRATLTNTVTGVGLFIRFSYAPKPVIEISPSLPKFKLGNYTLRGLVPQEEELKDTARFSVERVFVLPGVVGKEAARRIGFSVRNAWHYVTEQLDKEKSILDGKEKVIETLEAQGWKVQTALSRGAGEAYATKQGAKALTIDSLGRVSFYNKHFTGSAEAMAKAAEILGE